MGPKVFATVLRHDRVSFSSTHSGTPSAFQTRWWAVICHPRLAVQPIPPVPQLKFDLNVIHLLPSMLHMSPEHMRQLQLSIHELWVIYELYVGFPFIPHTTKGFVRPCDFHGKYHSVQGIHLHAMRHLHPQEVALWCGLFPSYVVPHPEFPLRLDLAGVGQMAPLIQSCWVLANVIHQMGLQGILQCQPYPQQRLWDLLKALLIYRDEWWNCATPSTSMTLFKTCIDQTFSIANDDGSPKHVHSRSHDHVQCPCPCARPTQRPHWIAICTVVRWCCSICIRPRTCRMPCVWPRWQFFWSVDDQHPSKSIRPPWRTARWHLSCIRGLRQPLCIGTCDEMWWPRPWPFSCHAPSLLTWEEGPAPCVVPGPSIPVQYRCPNSHASHYWLNTLPLDTWLQQWKPCYSTSRQVRTIAWHFLGRILKSTVKNVLVSA